MMQLAVMIITPILLTIVPSNNVTFSDDQENLQIAERIANFSNSSTNATGEGPIAFAAIKFEQNVLNNLTEDQIEEIKANLSLSTAEYMNETIDKLYQQTSRNETIRTDIYSIELIDNIIEILGLFFDRDDICCPE
jgi:hypothetical protein